MPKSGVTMSNPIQKQKILSRSILAGIVAQGGAVAADEYEMTNAETIAPAIDTPATRTVEFEATGATIEDLDVVVQFTKCAHAPYTAGDCPQSGWTGVGFDDLMFTLESPSGTTVSLIPFGTLDRWSHNYNFKGTVTFDDAADEEVSLLDAWSSPGSLLTYRPAGSLADFDGEALDGTWTLHLQYRTPPDPYYDLQPLNQPLAVERFTVSAVPEPGVTASGLAALASLSGLAALRRRRRL